MLTSKKIRQMEARYRSLFSIDGVDPVVINNIEVTLDIILPKDFKEISRFFSGGMIGNLDLFSIGMPDGADYDIVSRTLFYRTSELNLPKQYVALLESEVSFIVLESQDRADLSSPIIECSLSDAYNLAEGAPLLDNPVFYSSFAEFFSHLLDVEEIQRLSN